ncbi:MAG: DUF58 domain-containing protein [Planctomycetota bacterium]
MNFTRIKDTLFDAFTWPFRTLMRMTPDGLLFAALAVMCGMLSLGSNSWSNIPLLIALVLFALWMLSLWFGTRALKSVSFKRRNAEHVFSGEPLTITVQLTNASPLPVTGLCLVEAITRETPASSTGPVRRAISVVAAHGSAFMMALAGNETGRATYTLSLRKRGMYAFADSRIETVYPLGFFRSFSARKAPGQVIVYPRLGEVNASLYEDIERSLEAMRRSRPSRSEEEFRGLREYRKEDNPRWIHWRGSARAGELLVREFEEPLSKRVLLLLDTNLRGMGQQRLAVFENAISFAATAVREFARRGIEIECAAPQPDGQFARVTVSRARRNLDALLEMLALLRRDDSRSLDALVDILPRRSLHGTYILVIGLGSLRSPNALNWLRVGDNAVKVIDARSDEFARVFRRNASGSARDQAEDEDMLLSLGDDEAESVEA